MNVLSLVSYRPTENDVINRRPRADRCCWCCWVTGPKGGVDGPLAVCLVRFMVESPGPVWPDEDSHSLWPVPGVHVMTSPADRQRALETLDDGVAVALAIRMAERMAISLRTLQHGC